MSEQRSAFRPEERLLFDACSVAPDGLRAERLSRAAHEGLDGERLLHLALKNRVLPLVYQAVQALDGAGLGEHERAFLEAHARRHQARTLVHVHELMRLLERLGDAGIRAVPYKGPILAATLYRDLGEREFYDLDVLVPPQDLERAAELVQAQGFAPKDALEDERLRAHLAEDCELRFHHAQRDVLLELHWEALPRRHRRGFAVDEVWRRLVPLRLAGRAVEGFGPEDLMLVLCIHGGEKHRWSRLQMLSDVARILALHAGAEGGGVRGGAPAAGEAAVALDWQLLLRRARELGREETVLLGALCAALLLDAPLPAELRHAQESRTLVARAAATAGRIVRMDSGLVGHGTWRAYADELVARGKPAVARRPGLLGYLDVVLRPEWTDKQALALPQGLGFLYWLYRPLRLLRRHGAGLAGRL